MSKNFSQTERNLRKVLSNDEVFTFKNTNYKIKESGKPTPTGKGECKTDIYILAEDINEFSLKEFKLSIKQPNADFLENKMNWERAVGLFGEDAQKVITSSVLRTEEHFIKDYIVYFKQKGNTNAKSITLGWKFELFNKQCGNKSGIMTLSEEQKLDVFSGVNLPKDKKDARVNGKVIKDSGVANYILVVGSSQEESIDGYFNQIVPIEEYAKQSEIYLACKAVNYRLDKDKWDGDRPLAVYISWYLENNKLKGKFSFDNPLKIKANEIGNNLRKILKGLGIQSNNFDELRHFLDNSVKIYE